MRIATSYLTMSVTQRRQCFRVCCSSNGVIYLGGGSVGYVGVLGYVRVCDANG